MSKECVRLTDNVYWDQVWKDAAESVPQRPPSWHRLLTETPAERQFWRYIEVFLPKPPALVVELGSAPGANLLRWRQRFGYEIFGVDFSESGLVAQRRLFGSIGIDETHTLHADFLDPAFQRDYKDRFDVVHSERTSRCNGNRLVSLRSLNPPTGALPS